MKKLINLAVVSFSALIFASASLAQSGKPITLIVPSHPAHLQTASHELLGVNFHRR